MDDIQAALIAASNVTSDPDQVGALMVRYAQGITAYRAQTGQAAPTPAQAQQNVQNAMPGTTVARDLSSPEKRWMDALVNNPDDWYDNVADERASSGGGKGPDYRFKDENMEVKGLWLHSQYGDAPKWVFDKVNELRAAKGQPQIRNPYVQAATPAPAAPAGPGPAAQEGLPAPF